MKRRAFLALPLATFVDVAGAQEDYAQVLAGRPLQFPRDHGSHPLYRTEWWYATGWVTDKAGNAYGIQVTFFRNRPRVAEANPSAFAARQLLFAHAALADPRRGRLLHDQRAARDGFELAGADEPSTRVWINDWSLALDDQRTGERNELNAYTARIAAREERHLMSAYAASRQGQLITDSELRRLPRALTSALESVSRVETWHPMRSPWWIVPFALLLGAEWWWRRRNGLA